MSKLKNRIAWVKSFFTSHPVLTGQGFTTDDKSLKDLEETGGRRPGMARYTSVAGVPVILVGPERLENKIVYRVHDDQLDKSYVLDRDLFESLFRLQKSE
jgi:transposase